MKLMQWQEEYLIEVNNLEKKGVEGPFTILPIVETKRCFVPCNLGACNCRPTVKNNQCVIAEKYKSGKIAELNEHMNRINELAREALKFKDDYA